MLGFTLLEVAETHYSTPEVAGVMKKFLVEKKGKKILKKKARKKRDTMTNVTGHLVLPCPAVILY